MSEYKNDVKRGGALQCNVSPLFTPIKGKRSQVDISHPTTSKSIHNRPYKKRKKNLEKDKISRFSHSMRLETIFDSEYVHPTEIAANNYVRQHFGKHHRTMSENDVSEIFSKLQMEPHSAEIDEEMDFLEDIHKRIQDLFLALPKGDSKKTFLGFIENVTLTLYILSKCEDISTTIATCFLFAKTQFEPNSSFLTICSEALRDIFIHNNVEVEPQSGNIGNIFQIFRSKLNHPAFQKVGFLLSFLVTVGMVREQTFEIGSYKAFCLKALPAQTQSLDIFDGLLSTISFFFETGYECFVKCSLDPLWSKTDEISQFDADYLFLVSNIDRVRFGNLEEAGIDEAGFNTILSKSQYMVKHLIKTSPTSAIKSLYTNKQLKLNQVSMQFCTMQNSKNIRIQPFCFMLYGKSSVGKSTLCSTLMCAVLKHNGVSCADEHITYIQPEDKFYSTLKSNHTGVILDDMCNTKAKHTAVNPTARIIEIMNNVMIYANKASVEEKGQVFIKPHAVCITTNNATLDCEYWSVEPVSIMRRIQVRITVEVRQEYSVLGKLAAWKVAKFYPDQDESIKDLWLMTVEEVTSYTSGIAGAAEGFEWKPYVFEGKPMVNVDIFTLLRFMLPLSEKHYRSQEKLQKDFTNFGERINICKTCCSPFSRCACDVKPHSGYDEYMDVLSSTVINISTKVLKTAWHNIFTRAFPSVGEIRAIGSATTLSLFLYEDKLARGMFNWINYIPDSIAHSKLFNKYYFFVKRKEMIKDAQTSLTINSVCFNSICLGILWYTKPRIRISDAKWIMPSWIISSYVIYRAAIRKAHLNVQAELDQRNTTQCVLGSLKDARYSKLNSVLRNVGYIAGGVATIEFVRAIWRNLYKKRHEPQANLSPQDDSDISDRDSSNTPWSHKPRDLPKGDILSDTRTPSQLLTTVTKNLMYTSWSSDNGKKYTSNALFIKSNYMLVPKHIWYKDIDIFGEIHEFLYFDITRSNVCDGGSIFREKIFSQSVYFFPNMDLAMCYVPSGGTWRDLTLCFPSIKSGPTNALCSYRNKQGVVEEFTGYYTPDNTHYVNPSGGLVNIDGGRIIYSRETFPGMCMSPLIGRDKSTFVVGFHIAGRSGHTDGFCVSITRQNLQVAYAAIRTKPGHFVAHSSGDFKCKILGSNIDYSPIITTKAPISFIGSFYANVYGSCKGMATNKSTIRPSLLCPALEKHLGFASKWGPPVFAPNGMRWKPWRDTLLHLVSPRFGLNPMHLEYARRDYLSHLVPLVRGVLKQQMSPLTHMQVINGIDGLHFISAMNMSTSIGFPLTGSKNKYLVHLDPELYPDHCTPRDFIPDIPLQKEFEESQQVYLEGRRCYPVFKACLKDEALPFDKEKVRVFESAPLTLQYGLRKYFLPILRFLSIHPLVSECAVGINCYGDEWSQLHKHVTHFGEHRILAGDYSKWDLRLPAHLLGVAFGIMIDIARLSGNYTRDDIIIMEGIATDVFNPVVAYNGTLIEFFGSNPSGQNLTAHLNSVCNSLLIRMAFYSLEGMKDFRSFVKIITYGDDLIGSVSEKCASFNHLTVRDYLADIDISFTMPDKKSQAIPFMHIDNADFLKRKSTFNKDLNCFVGALELDSIYKSLYCFRKGEVAEVNVMSDVISGALFELVLHGEKVYKEHQAIFMRVCEDARLIVPVLSKTYEERVFDWIENYSIGNIVAGAPVVGSMLDNVGEDLFISSLKVARAPVVGSSPDNVL